jgi:hypothetical protein
LGVAIQFNYAAWAGRYPELAAPTTSAAFTGAIDAGATLTISAVVSGILVTGALIIGVGIAPNTAIVAQLTGTAGGAGTYSVNIAQTVASETMTASNVLEYFNEATIYWRNDGGGPVNNAVTQSALLNMLTAHIAALNAPLNGQPSSPLVGRINNASQGSVSVTAEYRSPDTDYEAWANQTKYGAAWWAATLPYRLFHYRVAPQRRFNPPVY